MGGNFFGAIWLFNVKARPLDGEENGRGGKPSQRVHESPKTDAAGHVIANRKAPGRHHPHPDPPPSTGREPADDL
jgi:hypothetical protein